MCGCVTAVGFVTVVKQRGGFPSGYMRWSLWPGGFECCRLGKSAQLENLRRQSIPLSPSSGFRPSPAGPGRACKTDPYKPSSFWREEAFQTGMRKTFLNPGDNRSCSFTQWSLHNNLWSGWSVYFRKASKWWEGGHAAFLLSLPVVSYSLFPVCSLLLTSVFSSFSF